MSLRPHHRIRGGFRNPWPGATLHGFGDFLKWRIVERRAVPLLPDPPRESFERATPDVASPRASHGELRATWVGHSTFLVQLGELNVLFDPIWSERASPVQFAGPKRWMPPGLELDTLPPIDVVCVSHNHYDHLDSPTVRRLAARDADTVWLCPKGLSGWLRKRGARTVAECDWYERRVVDDAEGHATAQVTCVPAQHFSGRGLRDRNRTLWCGWVVKTPGRAVLYAGDTGRHPEFALIGERYGPFDLVLMPVGAYDPRWFMQAVHMDPEEAVDAFLELRGATRPPTRTVMGAMHWGTFKLTDEPMDQPPARTREAWERAGLEASDLWVPKHGETLTL